jgi:hypothetical protein
MRVVSVSDRASATQDASELRADRAVGTCLTDENSDFPQAH